ncbi:MAG: response regulator transcription factor, partial [Bdellovibrio sp.]|nr:response regulator transcription factor [Bdellovibrio sp.]
MNATTTLVGQSVNTNSFSGHALVVEDDHSIANLLKIHLTDLGLKVDLAFDAESAFSLMQTSKYSVCLLDWMLPGIQGIDLLKKMRAQNNQIKVLMLTAKADPDSIVLALETGADDYLSKPFDSKVLLARVRNLLRRTELQNQIQEQRKASAQSEDEMTLDGLNIHFLKYIIRYKGDDVHLTPSEFKLLASLFKADGLVMTRDQLIAQIQGDEVNVTGRTIDTHVFALRKKLGAWSSHI